MPTDNGTAQLKNQLLAEWARYLFEAAYQGTFTKKGLILDIHSIAGPRAGALELFAGIQAQQLLSSLQRKDAALLRQFVPWDFVGAPSAFMHGRFVRVEAGWPSDLAETMVRLTDLSQNPHHNGRWVVGKNEMGATVVAGLNDKTPHYLVAGSSGSGKTVCLRNAVIQLSRDPDNQILLVDGKMGEGLGQLATLPGVVGPVAVDGPQARSALTWAAGEMKTRYQALAQGENGHGRLVVVIDEFQEWAGDQPFVDLLRKLAAQGRAAGVHLLAATQHPTVDAFGNASTRRNLSGKLALRVGDPDASRVAVGGKLPRADFLLGAGDTFAMGAGCCHRVQGAYVDQDDIDARGEWLFDEWDYPDAEAVGQELPGNGGARPFTGPELGTALVAAAEDEGRVLFQRRLEEAGLPKRGNNQTMELLALARNTSDWLQGSGWGIRPDAISQPARIEPPSVRPTMHSHTDSRIVSSVKWRVREPTG